MGVMIALTVALSAMLGCARSSQPMDNLSLSSSTRVQIPDAGACWTCSLPLQHELHQRRHHHEATTQQEQQQQRRHEHQDRQHYDHQQQQQQSTRQRGELASILTEAVKQHILARLQLRAPPNVSTRAPVPRRAVLSALRRLHHHGGSRPLTGAPAHGVHQTWAGHARRRAGYARDDDASTSGSNRGWSGELRFHVLGEGGRRLHVNQASLWLYLRMEARSRQRAALVTVRIQVSGAAPSSPSFSKRLMLRRASWRAVPLEAAAVRAALERAGGRVSLRVSCPDCGPAGVALGPRRVSAGAGAAAAAARVDPSAHRAFLLLRARDSGATRARGRKRRRGLECDGVAAPLCCRRHFYVDFGAIGWADWIIAPAGYFANYCEGKCPAFMSGALGTAASFHSAVLSQYRLRDTTAPGAGSCCIPTRLSAMSMLYFDEDQNIVKKDVPNMIVEECGCV
ncbi:unnamed protein product [Lampetra planeri]